MNASHATEFHEHTKHTWQRLRAEAYGLDWGNHPFPFKLYPDLEPLPLPRELPESGVPATEVLSGQVSVSVSALDLAGLARLLFFSAGVTRILHGVLLRAAPSAGALYPTELYAVCGPLADLPAGVYHFEPAEFALRRLRDGDFRTRLAVAATEPAIARLPLCLVLTGIPWWTTWKYRERGYRHLFWDAGAIVANLLAVATAAGWDARVLVGFVDGEVSALLGIGAPEEYPLVLVTVAAPAATAATASPPLAPISPRTRPLSRSPRGYPLGAAAQRAGDLPSAEAVSAWRRRPTGSGRSRRPGRLLRVTPARRTLPPTRSRP
jgi:SagB-type dehydrogenase family enzyme